MILQPGDLVRHSLPYYKESYGLGVIIRSWWSEKNNLHFATVIWESGTQMDVYTLTLEKVL